MATQVGQKSEVGGPDLCCQAQTDLFDNVSICRFLCRFTIWLRGLVRPGSALRLRPLTTVSMLHMLCPVPSARGGTASFVGNSFLPVQAAVVAPEVLGCFA